MIRNESEYKEAVGRLAEEKEQNWRGTSGRLGRKCGFTAWNPNRA